MSSGQYYLPDDEADDTTNKNIGGKQVTRGAGTKLLKGKPVVTKKQAVEIMIIKYGNVNNNDYNIAVLVVQNINK